MNYRQYLKNCIPDPIKYLAANTIRQFGSPPRLLRNLLAHPGKFQVTFGTESIFMTHTNRWIENDLFWIGSQGYEPKSTEVWMKAAHFARGVLDIGANSGLFSLLAQRVNPDAHVLSFEPLPMFYEILSANIKINDFPIQLSPVAISNYVGTSSFYVPQENQGNIYSSSLSKEHFEAHQLTKPIQLNVTVETIDHFMEKNNVNIHVDLVKIDAEGHDFEVVDGMRNTISKFYPDFLIEIHSDEVARKIMDVLSPDRYSYFTIDETTGLRRQARLSKSDGLNCFVCKHENVSKFAIRERS